MNAPLNSDARQQGGSNRDIGKPEWEAKFIGFSAAGARLIKRNHPAADNPALAREVLKADGDKFPWLILSIVGRDGRSVRSNLSNAEIEARIHQMGGALGLAGLVLLSDKRGPGRRLATYIRPFVAGPDVEERLTEAMEKLKPIAFGIVRDEMEQEQDKSPVTARVYTDGKHLSIYYSWEKPEVPEPGWELAGTVYLAKMPSGKWGARTQVTASKWKAIMLQAARRFESKMQEVEKALRGVEVER
jgi:hypothetical protein